MLAEPVTGVALAAVVLDQEADGRPDRRRIAVMAAHCWRSCRRRRFCAAAEGVRPATAASLTAVRRPDRS
jgi:hypothetical protein